METGRVVLSFEHEDHERVGHFVRLGFFGCIIILTTLPGRMYGFSRLYILHFRSPREPTLH